MIMKNDRRVSDEGSRLFCSGQIVATPGALAALEEANQTANEFLSRHLQGDWGDLCEDDKTANQEALEQGLRLLSSYTTGHRKLWIITEADRSVTTLLLPEDY
jgi:hypothetical protein